MRRLRLLSILLIVVFAFPVALLLAQPVKIEQNRAGYSPSMLELRQRARDARSGDSDRWDKMGLANLPCLGTFVEALPPDAEPLRISGEELRERLAGDLSSELPHLRTTGACSSFLVLKLNLSRNIQLDGRVIGYSGVVRLAVIRVVSIEDTGGLTLAPIWERGKLLWGATDTASHDALRAVDDFVSELARDYGLAGNT